MQSLRELKFDVGQDGVEELTAWNRVSEYWEDPPASDKIHIFVKLPEGECTPAISLLLMVMV